MNQLFDEAIYDALRSELGDEDTAEALKEFWDDTAGKMARLAVQCAERPVVKLEAHSIKSSAGTFGFARLSQLARELEAGAATLPFETMRESIRELRQTFEATREFAQAKLAVAA